MVDTFTTGNWTFPQTLKAEGGLPAQIEQAPIYKTLTWNVSFYGPRGNTKSVRFYIINSERFY